MFYIKKKISNDIEVNIDLYDDEIYTKCTKCGKEYQMSNEDLIHVLENEDLVSTTIECDKCYRKNNH